MTLPKNGMFDFIRGIIADVSKNVYAVIIVCLIASNVYFIQKWTNSMETRVVDKKEQYDRILRILMPRINRTVEKKVEQKTKTIEQTVDKAAKNLKDLTDAIKNTP